MKVFKIRDYLDGYFMVYDLIAANSSKEALEIANKISYGNFTSNDVEEIPKLDYDTEIPSIIFAIGEEIKYEYFKKLSIS